MLNQFTLSGFAGLVDALRLAADHGGRSRQIHAAWSVMSVDGRSRQSSCGATLAIDSDLKDWIQFDYIAVCGGNDYVGAAIQSPELLTYLQRAAADQVRLIGICTGTFAIAEAGLIGRRKVCINWNVLDVFRARFPTVSATADNLFVDEGDLITCAGSTAAIDLGLYLIGRHCGPDKARQALRHMILQDIRPPAIPQPNFHAELTRTSDVRVQQAVQFMEQRLDTPPSLAATARYVGVSERQLERIFKSAVGVAPKTFQRNLRLRYGRWLLENTVKSVTQIAFDCGFSDAAHFSREFRSQFRERPTDVRKAIPG